MELKGYDSERVDGLWEQLDCLFQGLALRQWRIDDRFDLMLGNKPR